MAEESSTNWFEMTYFLSVTTFFQENVTSNMEKNHTPVHYSIKYAIYKLHAENKR